MKTVLQLLSYLGLALTILPAILVFRGQLDLGAHRNLMFWGMLLWFGSTYLMDRLEQGERASQ